MARFTNHPSTRRPACSAVGQFYRCPAFAANGWCELMYPGEVQVDVRSLSLRLRQFDLSPMSVRRDTSDRHGSQERLAEHHQNGPDTVRVDAGGMGYW
jgi:hypothetical protein